MEVLMFLFKKSQNLFKTIIDIFSNLFGFQSKEKIIFTRTDLDRKQPAKSEKVEDSILDDLKLKIIILINNGDKKALEKLVGEQSSETIIALYEKYANEIFKFATQKPFAQNTPEFSMLQILLNDTKLGPDYCRERDKSWKSIMRMSNNDDFKPEKLWITANALITMKNFGGKFGDFKKSFYQNIAFGIGFNLLAKFTPTKDLQISIIYRLINDECIAPAIANNCPIVAKEVSSMIAKVSSMMADLIKVENQTTSMDIFSAQLGLLIDAIKSIPESKDEAKQKFIEERLLPKVVEVVSKICGIEWNADMLKEFKIANDKDRATLASLNEKAVRGQVIVKDKVRIIDLEKKTFANVHLISVIEKMLKKSPVLTKESAVSQSSPPPLPARSPKVPSREMAFGKSFNRPPHPATRPPAPGAQKKGGVVSPKPIAEILNKKIVPPKLPPREMSFGKPSSIKKDSVVVTSSRPLPQTPKKVTPVSPKLPQGSLLPLVKPPVLQVPARQATVSPVLPKGTEITSGPSYKEARIVSANSSIMKEYKKIRENLYKGTFFDEKGTKKELPKVITVATKHKISSLDRNKGIIEGPIAEGVSLIRDKKGIYDIFSEIAIIKNFKSDNLNIAKAVAGFIAFGTTDKAFASGNYPDIAESYNYTAAFVDANSMAVSGSGSVEQVAYDAAYNYVRKNLKSGEVIDVAVVIGAANGAAVGAAMYGKMRSDIEHIDPKIIAAAAFGAASAVVDKRHELAVAPTEGKVPLSPLHL
jgi:hypothetical protein